MRKLSGANKVIEWLLTWGIKIYFLCSELRFGIEVVSLNRVEMKGQIDSYNIVNRAVISKYIFMKQKLLQAIMENWP